MGVFDRQIATAIRLINKNGELVQWIDRVATPVDPATPWLPTGEVDTSTDVKIVFLPVGTRFLELLQIAAKSEVPVGSQKGLMAAVGFVPKIDSLIIRPSQNRQYKLKSIDTISPNGEIILYKLEFYA